MHTGMVGGALADGRAREGRVEIHVEEEEHHLERSFHRNGLLGNLRQKFCQATNRRGGGLLPGYICTKIGRPVVDVLQEKHPDICLPPMENPTYAAFKEYKKVLETIPLDFLEENVTWVASKFSGAAGALGAEAIELRNWLLCFGCALKNSRVVVANLANFMDNSYPPLGFLPLSDCMLPRCNG